MGELAGAQKQTVAIVAQWVSELEEHQPRLLKKAHIKNKFIIPGVNKTEAWCNVARTRIRFLERTLVKFSNKKKEYIKYIPYINRLSDFFFVLGQYSIIK